MEREYEEKDYYSSHDKKEKLKECKKYRYFAWNLSGRIAV